MSKLGLLKAIAFLYLNSVTKCHTKYFVKVLKILLPDNLCKKALDHFSYKYNILTSTLPSVRVMYFYFAKQNFHFFTDSDLLCILYTIWTKCYKTFCGCNLRIFVII